MPLQSPWTVFFFFFFFEKYSQTFFAILLTKNIVKHFEILPQHLLKKLSAIIYRLPISLKRLRFIDYRYRLEFFEIIDYRYRFTAERFIVPITDSAYGSAICMHQRLNILLRLPFSIPSFHPLLTFEYILRRNKQQQKYC